MNELVQINLWGDLGEKIGKTWNLSVKSVGEAVRAIQINSKNKLYKYLLNKDKENIKYRVLINNKPFIPKEPLSLDKIEPILNSELVIKRSNLKTIDIVPVLEGAKKFSDIILGVILITIGIIFPGTGPYLIPVGIALIAGGVIRLLADGPKFEDFREIRDGRRSSYLFDGPVNTIREGGPIPIGYGRLLVGSQVVSVSYIVKDVDSKKEEPRLVTS